MCKLRALFTGALLGASSLLAANTEPAHACSVLAQLQLEVVANTEPHGPVIFIARCAVFPEDCPELSTLRIPEVAGTFTTKVIDGSRDRLVLFTPASPLDATAKYSLLIGEPARQALSFSIADTGAPAPLERALVRDGKRTDGSGRLYQCSISPRPIVGCSDSANNSSLRWNELGIVHVTLGVTLPANSGWLFHAHERAAGPVDSRWQTSSTLEVDLTPGAETCIELEAWNVLTDGRASRHICKTGPLLSDAERNVSMPPPDLGECLALPTLGSGMESADWLLDTWCRDRRVFCATHSNGPNACGTPDTRCAKADPVGDESKRDGGAADPTRGESKRDDPAPDKPEHEENETAAAATDSPAMSSASQDHTSGSDVVADGDSGCSLARSGSRAASLGPLVLVCALGLLRRRARRRSGQR